MTDTRPIGVFDSGMGGLTVLKALRARLPGESFVYLGDTARLPYGTKSTATVTAYALQASRLLSRADVKMLVVACNTASAAALPELERVFAPLPVVGVIAPGAAEAVKATRSKRIAVVATEGTVARGAYVKAIKALKPEIEVVQQPCPLFVALAEEGWTSGEVAEAIARRYLKPLFDGARTPDTLLLGCTHFPVLAPAIRATLGNQVRLVDSAETTAGAVQKTLDDAGLLNGSHANGTLRFLATDSPDRFARVGEIFLGEPIAQEQVELVDVRD